MKKVFVLNDGGLDYSAAEKFGEIIFCSSGNINRWDTAYMFRLLDEPLSHAREEDYILINGLTPLCCVAVGIMAAQYGRVNMLLFKDGDYLERTTLFT